MGVLEIRGQSERLGNVAGLPLVNARTGATEYWGSVRQSLAEQTRGRQEIARGIGELGRGIGDAVTKLDAILTREDERKFDRYYTELSKEFDSHYEGVTKNGERTGALYQNIGSEDLGYDRWEAESRKAEDRAKAKAIKAADISEDDAARYEKDRRIVGFRQNWQSRKNAAVGSAFARSEQKLADDALQAAVDNAVKFGTSDAADQVIKAAERKCSVHGLHDPGAHAATIAESMRLVENGRLATMEESYGSEAEWDDAIKKAKEGTFWEPGFSDVLGKAYGWANEKKTAIEQGKRDHDPAKAHGAKIAEALAKGKTKWVAMDQKRAGEQALEMESGMLSVPVPDNSSLRELYFRDVEKFYRAQGANRRLPAEKRLQYVKKADAAAADAKGVDTERKKDNGELIDGMFQLGVRDAASALGIRQLTADEKLSLVETAFANGAITYRKYAEKMAEVGKELEPEALQFRQEVSQGLDDAFPAVVDYQAKDFSFRLGKSAKAYALSASQVRDVENRYVDKGGTWQEEKLLYGQFVANMEAAWREAVASGAKDRVQYAKDALKRINEDSGTQDRIDRLSIRRRNEASRNRAAMYRAQRAVSPEARAQAAALGVDFGADADRNTDRKEKSSERK